MRSVCPSPTSLPCFNLLRDRRRLACADGRPGSRRRSRRPERSGADRRRVPAYRIPLGRQSRHSPSPSFGTDAVDHGRVLRAAAGREAPLRPPSLDIDRGYAAKNSESLYHSLGEENAPADLFEAFNIGPDILPDGGRPATRGPCRRRRSSTPRNLWPTDPSQAVLKPALMDYFDAGSSAGAPADRALRPGAGHDAGLLRAVHRSLDRHHARQPLRAGCR